MACFYGCVSRTETRLSWWILGISDSEAVCHQETLYGCFQERLKQVNSELFSFSPCSTISSELSGAIRKSVRHPTLPGFTGLWVLCLHLNSPRATYSAARRGLGTQRWRPGSSHSSTCHRCSPSVHSTGTTCGCHPPGRCWSGTAGPRGAGTASSPSGTARAHRVFVSRGGRERDTAGRTEACSLHAELSSSHALRVINIQTQTGT